MLISKFDTTNIEQKIVGFESKYNIKLPNQYRQFMLRYNGGYTPETILKVGPRREENVSCFYGFGMGEEYGLDEHCWLMEWIRHGFLPIADEFFGNEYVLGITSRNYGKVYFFDHEEQMVEQVRNSFKDFIASCKSEKIGRIASIREREETLIARGLAHNITDALRQAWQEEIDFYGNMVQEPVILDESEH